MSVKNMAPPMRIVRSLFVVALFIASLCTFWPARFRTRQHLFYQLARIAEYVDASVCAMMAVEAPIERAA
jgi:hypothetical protein